MSVPVLSGTTSILFWPVLALFTASSGFSVLTSPNCTQWRCEYSQSSSKVQLIEEEARSIEGDAVQTAGRWVGGIVKTSSRYHLAK